jgi:hypothetical protein
VLKSKATLDKNTVPHKFKIGDKVLISNDFYIGKNKKLAPTFTGPGKKININDTNAKVKINYKIKILNVNKLKIFLKMMKVKKAKHFWTTFLMTILAYSHSLQIN